MTSQLDTDIRVTMVRVTPLNRTFDIDSEHPFAQNHQHFPEVSNAINLVIANPRQLYVPSRDQWNFLGKPNYLPATLRPSRGGASWVMPINPDKPGKIGFIVTPLNTDGQTQRIKSLWTQVRTQLFVHVDLDQRSMVHEVLKRAFQRTYGVPVEKVTDHSKSTERDPTTGFLQAEHSWVYVKTRVPVEHCPLYIIPEDLDGFDFEAAKPLLHTTLWQEPVINEDLVAPHRGCAYCHDWGHAHNICDSLKRHRHWITRGGPHPLLKTRPPVSQASQEQVPPPPSSPRVRFVPLQVQSDSEDEDTPASRATPAKKPRSHYSVPEGLPDDVYNALQKAYTHVNLPDPELIASAEEVIRLLRRNRIDPPNRSTRNRGQDVQSPAAALALMLRKHRNPQMRQPNGRPTQMETYFNKMLNLNPFKPGNPWRNEPDPPSQAKPATPRPSSRSAFEPKATSQAAITSFIPRDPAFSPAQAIGKRARDSAQSSHQHAKPTNSTQPPQRSGATENIDQAPEEPSDASSLFPSDTAMELATGGQNETSSL